MRGGGVRRTMRPPPHFILAMLLLPCCFILPAQPLESTAGDEHWLDGVQRQRKLSQELQTPMLLPVSEQKAKPQVAVAAVVASQSQRPHTAHPHPKKAPKASDGRSKIKAGGSRTKSLSIRGTDDAGGSNSNGTKAPRNPMCSVVLTGDDCRKPVHLPRCLPGVFRGRFMVLNKAFYAKNKKMLNTVPARLTNEPRKVSEASFRAVLKALPDQEVLSTREPTGRCALVGSDRTLRSSAWGKIIDGFDVVMRINGAPTLGFQEQVGSRTTHRFVSNGYVGWREGNETLVSKWSGSVSQLIDNASKSTTVVNPHFLDYSQSRFFTENKHLVTQGFRALLLLMHTCQAVHVFGFQGPPGGWYYDKKTNRRGYDKALHNGNLLLPPTADDGGAHSADVNHAAKAEDMQVMEPQGEGPGGEPLMMGDTGGSAVGTMRVRDLPRRPRDQERRLRRQLLGTTKLPKGHRVKFERDCMARLAQAGVIRRHDVRKAPRLADIPHKALSSGNVASA